LWQWRWRVNSVNIKTAKNFTKGSGIKYVIHFINGFLFSIFFFAQVTVRGEKAQSITAPVTAAKIVAPTSAVIAKPADTSAAQQDEELVQAIKKAVQPVEPTNEIVILNTETGFIPDKIRVKKGEAYKVHVVNLNMKEKNTSFLMDSFSQYHNTVFGFKRSFNIEPQVEGIYSYQCPETGIQGQLVVIKDAK